MTRRNRVATWAGLVTLPAMFALVGCASPGDVTAEHERHVADLQRELSTVDATYREKLAAANEWNDHFMGIPSAGWIPLLVVAGLIVTGLLVWLTYTIIIARTQRRNQQHQLALEHEKTLRVAAERGACTVCGAQPIPELKAKTGRK